MALAYIAPEVGVPLTAGVSALKGSLGDANYGRGRSTLTWAYGAANGFLPIPPMIPLLPFKIAIFVIAIMLFMALGMSGGKSFLAAYLTQAIIIMYASEWILDKALSVGIGA